MPSQIFSKGFLTLEVLGRFALCPVKLHHESKRTGKPPHPSAMMILIRGGSRLNENTARDARLTMDVKVMIDGEINIQSMLFDCDITPVV